MVVRVLQVLGPEPSERRRSTTHVSTHVVVGLLRLKPRRIPACTRRKKAVAPVADVRAATSVGSPCEVARPRATSTLPGGATRDGVARTARAVSPTRAGVCPSEVHATLLPLLHSYGAFPGRGFAGE